MEVKKFCGGKLAGNFVGFWVEMKIHGLSFDICHYLVL